MASRRFWWGGALPVLALLATAVAVLADETASEDKYAQLKECRRLLKNAVASIDAGQYGPALATLDSVTAQDASNADAFFYRGLALTYSGDTTQATLVLSEGVAAAPMSSRLKLLLARLKILAGESSSAAPLIDAVLAIKPREGEALYLKGLTQLNQGDTTQALEFFDRALQRALLQGEK